MDVYEPHEIQAAAHDAFLNGTYKRGTIFWGRRVGKTLWSIWQVIIGALLDQGNYWMVFDTRQHAKEVLWDTLIATLPPGLAAKVDASDMTITFKRFKGPVAVPGKGWVEVNHDKKLPSKIILTGSDYADRDRGGEANGIIFDEYQDQEPDKWEEVYEPFLSTTGGWAAFMGTAKGYNHWYDLMEFAKQDDRWFHSEAIWKANPLISKEWIADSKETARKRGKLDIWLREYELRFMTPQKAVYPMFDRHVHIKPPEDVPAEGTDYGAWDFGFAEGHPAAFVLVRIDNQGRWWVRDELFGIELDMDRQIEIIKQKTAGLTMAGIVADSARPDLIDYARSKGLNLVPSPKRQGHIIAGIELLRQKLTPRSQLVGEPEPELFITRNCRNAVVQMEKYEYKETKEGRPQSELPLKQNDDIPDALRYLALWLKYGLTKKRPRPNTVPKLNDYGFPTSGYTGGSKPKKVAELEF